MIQIINYDLNTSKEEFKKELLDAGFSKIEVIEEKGHLYGIGWTKKKF